MLGKRYKVKGKREAERGRRRPFTFHLVPFTSLGFTFVEVLVVVAVLAIVATGMFQAFVRIGTTTTSARAKMIGTFLGNELMEEARNLPYEDVGVLGGLPDGKIARTRHLTRNDLAFTITSTVRSIDDPFDGTLGSTTKPDLSSADYKLVEIEVNCDICESFSPIVLTTNIAPKAMEGSDTGGGILIKSFDANGQSVAGASVHVVSTGATIDDVTDYNGELTLVGLPAGLNAYGITVTKSGYTTDKTYKPNLPANPNPVKPDSTVQAGALTSIGFAIDKFSSLSFLSRTTNCAVVPNVDFHLMSSRKIGINPDLYKINGDYVTESDGVKTIAQIEWDDYVATLIDAAYDLAGTMPFSTFSLSPAITQNFYFIVEPKTPKALLVTVRDAATKLPITDATVTITNGAYSDSKTTGRGAKLQTDWSGGGGEATSTNLTKYLSSDGNIETNSPAGDLKLAKVGSDYAASGVLTSSAFDTGAASTFYSLKLSPADQPVNAGTLPVRLQIASNNDGGTWNYVGPDGTATTYYTSPNSTISASHSGDRYFRYKLYMNTASTTFTPTISDISFTYTTECTPSGQVFWNGLSLGPWEISASHADYLAAPAESKSLNTDWQELVFDLTHR